MCKISLFCTRGKLGQNLRRRVIYPPAAERRTDMNIEQVKQFIKEVRWGILATTDGRPQCMSVFLSVSVRVYEILAGKT